LRVHPWKPFPVRSYNLRARPETTQLEHLSDASFLGKLLVLPANVILDWKVIAKYKHSSLFGLVVSYEGNKFYKIDARTQNTDTEPRILGLAMVPGKHIVSIHVDAVDNSNTNKVPSNSPQLIHENMLI
jgi:hypothetical protein